MSRYRTPLGAIDVEDNEEDVERISRTVPTLDFTSTRKKGRTPKKRTGTAFTPMKISDDVKPKLEPESPTQSKVVPVAKPKRAVKAKAALLQPKTEPDQEPSQAIEMGQDSLDRSIGLTASQNRPPTQEDVKPDVRELENLLDDLNLDRSGNDANRANARVDVSRPPSPINEKPTVGMAPSTPLFMPYESPDQSPVRLPRSSSTSSNGSSAHNSPRMQARSTITQAPHSPPATSNVDPFDLFSSDSPPPPQARLRSPSASSSSASCAMTADHLSDHDTDPPVAGPSRSRADTGLTRARSTSISGSPQSRSELLDVLPAEDIKPSREALEDMKPSIASLISATPSSKPRRRAFLDFLETVARADSGPEDDYEYDENESEGSLKDFIVDDDEISYLSESEDGEGAMGSEEEDSDIVEVKVDRSAHPFDSDANSDIIVEEAVSHPKIGKATGLDFLDDFEESDREEQKIDSDADDLLEAIDNLTIATPATKAKTKGKKTAKAPKWAEERVRIAQEVFDDLDKRVFDNQLGVNGAGAKIIWNKRLLTTAGTAQRKRRRHPGGETSWEVGIQLSEKVCTGQEQILSTVAHEMCHLACWVIDKEFKNPHGKIFKSWGRKVMRKRDDLEVTTKHDYVIEYKYHWRCVDCKKVYKRHSKSIDIEKQGCGICKGKLEALFETKSRGTSTFQVYLKQNMKLAKAALPKATHGEVMRALSARWTEAGPEADHETHWKAVLAASRG